MTTPIPDSPKAPSPMTLADDFERLWRLSRLARTAPDAVNATAQFNHFCLFRAEAILAALRASDQSYEAHPEWRCFHCDEVFATREAAQEHFGPNEDHQPACQIDITKFREMESFCARCLAEDSDKDREFHGMRADHAQALIAEEQKGYDKGVKDGRQAGLHEALSSEFPGRSPDASGEYAVRAERERLIEAEGAIQTAFKIARPWINGKISYEEWSSAVDAIANYHDKYLRARGGEK